MTTDGGPLRAELRDNDGEGQGEAVLDNGRMRVVLTPAAGGRLVEWLYHPPDGPACNLFASDSSSVETGIGGTALRLAFEGQTPLIQPGLGPAPPAGLTDHFLPLTSTFRDFADGRGRDLGDLAMGAFAPLLYEMGERWEVALVRATGLRAGKKLAPLTVTKKISLGPSGTELAIHYRIENRNDKPLQVFFASQWTFALEAGANSGHGGRGWYELDGQREPGAAGFAAVGSAPRVTSLALVEPQPGLTVRLGWDREAALWVCPYPVGTHGDKVRGACVMPVWELRLPPDDNWALGVWASVGAAVPPAPLPPGLAERIARTEWDDEPWKREG